jgi:hypothetical protein
MMNISRLLIAHAIVTGAAGIVLIWDPGLILGLMGVELASRAFVVCYLLAAAELSLSILSYLGSSLDDPGAIRTVSLTIITFHAASALVESYAAVQAPRPALWVNIIFRLITVFLFFRYGIFRSRTGRAV